MGAWDLFNALLDLFRPPAEPEPPVFRETVSDGTLRTLLIDQLNADPGHVHLSDAHFDLFDRASLDRLLAWFAIGRKPWLKESRDCFLPDTPILCRVAGQVEILEIQDLAAIPFPSEVLNHQGQWVPVHGVWPKETQTKVLNHTFRGSIGLTEDHKVKLHGEWVEARRPAVWGCSIDQKPIGTVLPDDGLDNPEFGWSLGLFFADGHAGEPRLRSRIGKEKSAAGAAWRISNYNLSYLERAKAPLSAFGRELEIQAYASERKGTPRGGVIPRQDMFHLVVKKQEPRSLWWGTRNRFVDVFRRSFYTSSGLKKVPAQVLSASLRTKSGFIDGVWAGDGEKREGGSAKNIVVHGRIGLLGLIAIAEAIRAEWAVSVEPRRENTYYFRYRKEGHKSRTHPRLRDGPRARTMELNPPRNRVVFDLSCEGGEFIAANYLVHNCDDFARSLCGKESAWASRRAEDRDRAGSSAFAEVWGDFGFGYHALNAWVEPKTRKVWLVEPQNGSVYAPPVGTKVGLVLC